MSDNKKKRLSMLDAMASAGTAAPAPGSMMNTNRALRSARDAVDNHRVWDLDPALIDDNRHSDRLDPSDVADLRASIEANGQAVPILVRRHPQDPERYALVYGRRRLEAIRGSDKVRRVRALIAALDEQEAIRAQVTENTARRDLSYIERALFAQSLLDSGFGNQSQIADVLNTTKSAISMGLTVAGKIGPELAQAIGPAHGIGRPRWEALAADLAESPRTPAELAEIAARAYAQAAAQAPEIQGDPSTFAFQAVAKAAAPAKTRPRDAALPPPALSAQGAPLGKVQRTAKGLKLELHSKETDFLTWLEARAQDVIDELHHRWQAGGGKK